MATMCSPKQDAHLDAWHHWDTDRNVHGGTFPFGKIRMENPHVHAIQTANGHSSLAIPKALPDCIEVETTNQTLMFKMLYFRC